MSSLSITALAGADGSVRLHAIGEIDADNAYQLRDTVSALIVETRPDPIEVDMSAVTFIDSVGVGALVACYHMAATCRVRLMMINPSDYVYRILYISGLLGLLGCPTRPPQQQPRTAANRAKKAPPAPRSGNPQRATQSPATLPPTP
jgi:anti-anti-sigma factor